MSRAVVRHVPYLLIQYVVRSVAALLAGYGVASWARDALGAWPAGDWLLFEPGRPMLLEALTQHGSTGMVMAQQAALIGIVMIPIGLLTTSMLMVSLTQSKAVPVAQASFSAIASTRSIAILWFLFTAAQAGSLGLGYLLAEGMRPAVSRQLGVQAGDVTYVVLIAFGILGALVFGVVQDLARITAIATRLDAASATLQGWRSWLGHPVQVLVSYWSRGAAALVTVMLASIAVEAIGLRRWWQVACVMLVHQLVLVVLTMLRAWWLGRAVEWVEVARATETGLAQGSV